MTDDTSTNPAREFARSFQSLVNVVSPGFSGRLIEHTDEMKAAAEVATHRFLEAARCMEHSFAKKYVLFSTYFPEELLKEETTEMKSEIERKDALIAKYTEKLPQWQQHLVVNVESTVIPVDITKT